MQDLKNLTGKTEANNLALSSFEEINVSGGGGVGGAGLSAANISLGDKKANTLDATIGNQTTLEFDR